MTPVEPAAPRRFLYVGVMTAQKYLASRAVAAYKTWARSVPGRVEFFSSAGSEVVPLPAPLPLVALPGVDDSYPPQKKSFMMLKYIHDHHLQQYEWFMRADDDVYVRGERLERFLRSLNSSKPLYLGQTGLGVAEELGRLALEPGENFCMGGPGMIFSREVLRRMVPHIGTCLREMFTTHEDVEVGRCVRRFGGTQCVWSYEMQQLFYENYEQNKKGFIEEVHSPKLHRALTLHPNKRPSYQYRLHSSVLSRRISGLRHRSLLLHRDSLSMSRLSDSPPRWDDLQLGAPPSFVRFQPRDRSQVLDWAFLTGRHLYPARDNTARHNLRSHERAALEDVIMQVMEMINENSKTRGRVIDFKEVHYGYRRVDPVHGAEYILDLLLLYRKHKGRKVTVPVRRHAYLQQSFSRPFVSEAQALDVPRLVSAIDAEPRSFLHDSLRFLTLQLQEPLQEPPREPWGQSRKKVHILVPLSGRYDAFLRFMHNFEKVCLVSQQNVKLSVVLVESDGPAHSPHEQLIQEYLRRHPKADIDLIPMTGNFSRGLALEVGSALLHNDTLLFFCDVDLMFTGDALQRCRDNAVLGERAYFPIVFSQYDPRVVYAEQGRGEERGRGEEHRQNGGEHGENQFVFTRKSGFWRDYGFGVTCIYKGDLVHAGGFDTSILGWGLEDVDLFSRVVSSGLQVLRSQEPGIVHVHHTVHCNASLEQKQLRMCLGSRASTFGSAHQLAEMWLEKHAEAGFNRSVS